MQVGNNFRHQDDMQYAIVKKKQAKIPYSNQSGNPRRAALTLLFMSTLSSVSGSSPLECSFFGNEKARISADEVLARPEKLYHFLGDGFGDSTFDVLSRPDKEEFLAAGYTARYDYEIHGKMIAETVRLPARDANVKTFCYYENLGPEFDDCRDLSIAKNYVSMIVDETIESSYRWSNGIFPVKDSDKRNENQQYLPLYKAYKKELQRLERRQNSYYSHCLANHDFCNNDQIQGHADKVDQAKLKFLTEASNAKKHFKAHLSSLKRIDDLYSRYKCKERQANRYHSSFGGR